jgi:hypothetical protein
MNKSYKKILSLSFGCFISAASYAAAPDFPSSDEFAAAAQAQRPSRQKFSSEEDQQLRDLVAQYGTGYGIWTQIAPSIPGKTAKQCSDRWRYRTRWTPEEDQQLRELVNQHGTNWTVIADNMPGRTARQCRERWNLYLNPTLTNNPWTPEEDKLLLEKYKEFGPKWTRIAEFLSGRTDLDCQNRRKTLPKRASQAARLMIPPPPPQQQLMVPPPPPPPPQQQQPNFSDWDNFENDFEYGGWPYFEDDDWLP